MTIKNDCFYCQGQLLKILYFNLAPIIQLTLRDFVESNFWLQLSRAIYDIAKVVI